MTNKEAYLSDLEDILNNVDDLLRLVPVGRTVKDKKNREQVEEIAEKIKTTIALMKNDYIPEEPIYQDEPINYDNYMKDKLKSVGLEEGWCGGAQLVIGYRRFEIWYQGSLAFWTDVNNLPLLKETWERYCTNPPKKKRPGFDATLWN